MHMLLEIYKEQARRLEKRLATRLRNPVNYSFWLEAIADLHGVRDWNSLSALLRKQHSDATLASPDDAMAMVLDQSLWAADLEASAPRWPQPHTLLTGMLALNAPAFIIDLSESSGFSTMVKASVRHAGRDAPAVLELGGPVAWNPLQEAATLDAQARVLLAFDHGRDVGRGLHASHCHEVAVVVLDALTAAGLPVTPRAVVEFLNDPAYEVDGGLPLRHPALGWDHMRFKASAVREAATLTLYKMVSHLNALSRDTTGILSSMSSDSAAPLLRNTLLAGGSVYVPLAKAPPRFRQVLAQVVAVALAEVIEDLGYPAVVMVHGPEVDALVRPLSIALSKVPGGVLSRV